MKKISILLLTALSCSAAFLSCGFQNLQAPKEVVVRTDATYEFSVMNFDSEKEGSKLNLSKYFDFGKTLEEKTAESADSSNMKVYKYNNGSQYQQYLIHMPLKEVDFDLTETFSKMDFSESMKNFNLDKEIKVPKIDTNEKTQPIDLSAINEALNGLTYSTGTAANSVQLNFSKCDSTKNFDSITYTSGKLIVACPTTGTVTLKSNGKSSNPATISNGKAEIDISTIEGKTIDKSSSFLEFSYPNGTFTACMDLNSKIKNAENVKLTSATVDIDDITFKVTMSEDITDCEIAKGSITIAIPDPNTWSPGVIGSYTVVLSGGLNKTVTGSAPASINNSKLTNQEILAETTINLNLNGKDISFDPAPNVKVTVDIEAVNATVKIPEDYKDEIPKSEPVSGDLKKYVEVVQWKPSGFNVTGSHNLPAEDIEHNPIDDNDITLSFTSTFFNMNGTDANSKKAVAPNTEYGSELIPALEFRGDPGKTKFRDETPASPAPADAVYRENIDVTGKIILPGYNDTNKTITVKYVVPGETYNINLVVEPVFEWETAWVKVANDDSSKMKDVINAHMNKQDMFKVFGADFAEKNGDKINFKTLPLYIYAEMPNIDIFNDASYNGKIIAYYGKEMEGEGNAGKYEKITTSPETILKDGDIALVNTPKLELNEEGYITAAMIAEPIPFQNALNMPVPEGSEGAPICVDYDIKFGGAGTDCMPITPTQMEEAKKNGASKIKMDIIMLMTMEFTTTDTVGIDMLSLAKKSDSDLLGRSEASSNETIEKFLSVVKTATLNIDEFYLPMTGDVSLSIDMYKDGNKVSKPAGSGETYSVEVNPLTLIQTYPLQPDVQFVIGKPNQNSNFGILRTMPISGKIRLRIEADGDIPVYSNKD